MHYPHEREERKELFCALVDDAQKNFAAILQSVLAVGLLSCGAALVSSLLIHPHADTPAWSWIAFWIFAIFLGLLVIFFLPKLLPIGPKRKLIGIKRGFLIRSTLPPLLYFSILGCVLALSFPEHLFLASVIWAGGYAMSLLSISPFHLPALKNLALAIISLSLGLMIVCIRHETEILPHHLANLTILIVVSLPCIAFSLFFLVLKKQ